MPDFSPPMRDLQGFLEPKDVKAIIEAATNQRDEMLIKTLWVTGARISEIVSKHGIRPVDIGEDAPIIVMRTLKRRQIPYPERRVTVPEKFHAELTVFGVNTPGDEPIFSITRQRAFQIVRATGALAGIERVGRKRIHPHHFRHSHCVAYARGNNTLEGLRKLQQRLKHGNITTTAHYLQYAGEDQKDIEKIYGE